MHFRRGLVGLLAILLLAATPANAQDNGSIPGIEELTGLESGVARAFTFDFSTMGMESTPVEYDRFVLVFAGWVFEFDSPDNAAAGFDSLVDTAGAEAIEVLAADGAEVEPEEIEDLGDRAIAWGALQEGQSTSGYTRYLIMQQESYVFLIMIIAESEETALESNELAAYFSAQVGEGHSGTGEMVGEEAYTGGLWEFFPPAGHELYAGLIAGGDTVVFPVESA